MASLLDATSLTFYQIHENECIPGTRRCPHSRRWTCTGCEKKSDAVTTAEHADKNAGIAAPGIEETKAIAEEGFIYGLPIVMNYAVMYEFCVDKNSGQYKAPFNQDRQRSARLHLQGTAVVTPNSDTPYSMVWLDLRAEPMVISVPAVEKERYYSVKLCDGNTYNYGYIGSRATGNEPGDYMVVGPDWKGETPAGIKKSVPVHDPIRAHHFPHPTLQPGGHAQRVQGAVRLQGAAAFGVPQTAGAARGAGDRLPAGRPRKGIKENFFEYLDFALQFVPATPEEKDIRAKLASIGIGPGKTFNFKDLSLEHKAEVLFGDEGRRRQG